MTYYWKKLKERFLENVNLSNLLREDREGTSMSRRQCPHRPATITTLVQILKSRNLKKEMLVGILESLKLIFSTPNCLLD